MWDIFISYASEDKDGLVRPLAEMLKQSGVKVWYDDFSLSVGDSLTASIDRGLQESKYGLIVISHAFFEKNWTDYELKSLLTKEINGKKVILPIWHNVTPDFVASKSLYLADKKAISSDEGIQKLTFAIISVVRPDIINSHLIKNACRKASGHMAVAYLEDLRVIDGVRHKTLPRHLVIATDILSSLFPSCSYHEMLTNFAKDVDYDHEFLVWTAISCAYLDVMREHNLSFADEKSEKVYYYLLLLSLEAYEACETIELDVSIKNSSNNAYINHLQRLRLFIQNQ